MLLEELRNKALFQNTIDIWIAYCEENNLDWYNIQQSGGTYERGRDKSKFLEELSHYSDDDASAFIAKLNQDTIQTIRKFKASN